MFDVIGKRRWFYLLSLLLTIPGLVFILLTPFTRRRPAVHHRLHRRDEVGDQVRGPDGHARPGRGGLRRRTASRPRAITTGSGFIEIKTEPIGLVEAPRDTGAHPGAEQPVRSASASAEWQPGRVREPAPSASPARAPRRRRPRAPAPRRRPARARRQSAPSAAPSGTPSSRPTASSARSASALEARARQDRGAEQPDDHRPGRELRPGQPGAHPDPRRVARDPAVDHLPVP